MSSPVITFDNVSKRFSRGYYADSLRDAVTQRMRRIFSGGGHDKAEDASAFWALRGVSFEVQAGEVLGIIGSNGSGKSTTLKLLSRILRPDEGQIRVAGRLGALIELGAGFSPDLSGRENVFLNASILGMSKQEIESKYDEIVDFAELHDFMDTPVKWYSSGMFARLGFSVAVHTDPQVLLVDEVLSVGDVGFQKKCFDKMMEFKNRSSVTIIFVSHNLNAVNTLCNRVALLEKGVLLGTGEPGEMVRKYMEQVSTSEETQFDKMITILEAGLCDGEGKRCLIFDSSDRASARLVMRFNTDLENVLVAIMVKSGDDTLIFGTNSMRLGSEGLSVKQGEVVIMELDLQMNLAPGSYTLSTAILKYHKYEYVCGRDLLEFGIKEDPRYRGFANLQPRLTEFAKQSACVP